MTEINRRPWSDPQTGFCPVAETLRTIGGKHKPNILHCLLSGEVHFLELGRQLDGISRKVLKEQLRDLEDAGLVKRVEKDDSRRSVGYSLTGKGLALGEIVSQLNDWWQIYNAGPVSGEEERARK
ncbi:MAG: helix-turn-helix transcriptional regulator [Nitratireductor sp.]|nr:helix-turn-helix transcriptional regulator [Nitratireductor sp.]